MACQSSLTLKVLRTLWGLKIITARSIKALKIPSLLAPRPSIVYNRGIEYFHGTSRGSLQGTICVHSHPDGPGSAKSCCPCRRCRPPLPAASAREIRAAIKGAARRGCGTPSWAERLPCAWDRVCAPSECAGLGELLGALYSVYLFIFNLISFLCGFCYCFGWVFCSLSPPPLRRCALERGA